MKLYALHMQSPSLSMHVYVPAVYACLSLYQTVSISPSLSLQHVYSVSIAVCMHNYFYTYVFGSVFCQYSCFYISVPSSFSLYLTTFTRMSLARSFVNIVVFTSLSLALSLYIWLLSHVCLWLGLLSIWLKRFHSSFKKS